MTDFDLCINIPCCVWTLLDVELNTFCVVRVINHRLLLISSDAADLSQTTSQRIGTGSSHRMHTWDLLIGMLVWVHV